MPASADLEGSSGSRAIPETPFEASASLRHLRRRV
jgi:hypothetical protein